MISFEVKTKLQKNKPGRGLFVLVQNKWEEKYTKNWNKASLKKEETVSFIKEIGTSYSI